MAVTQGNLRDVDAQHATLGKGEKVGQEPTASVVTPEAWKTPRGARPNRRGEPARLVEHTFLRRCASSVAAKTAANANPRVGCSSHGANRDLEE